MLESGYRISDLKSIPLTGENCKFKNKIALDNTFLFGYAHTVYGTTYNRHNYKISLDSLRADIKGYIGIESLVAPWSEQLKLWHGSWDNAAEHNKSYVWEWEPKYYNHEHYNAEKFTDLENSYYIIKDAPFPYETEDLNNRDKGEVAAETNSDGSVKSINLPIAAADPHPDSNKIVTKSYIDERIASKRLVEVTPDFWIRDYDCVYILRAEELKKLEAEETPTLKVHFSEAVNKRSLHNKLAFSILIEGTKGDENKWSPAITKSLKWEFYNFDNEKININWLNNTDNEPIDITKNVLYDNARYCVFDVEVVNDKITSTNDPKTASWTNNANLTAFITCINALYRLKGSVELNGFKDVVAFTVDSPDNSVFVNSKTEVIENVDDENGTYTKINVDVTANLIGENGIRIVPPLSKEAFEQLKKDQENNLDEDDPNASVELENGWKIGLKDDFIEGDHYINVSYNTDTDKFQLGFNSEKLDLGGIELEGDEYINVNFNEEEEKFKLSLNTDNLEFGDEVNQYITELPSSGVVDINNYNSVYFTNNNNLNISFDASNLEEQQTITTVIYFKFSETAAPNVTGVKWVKSEKNIAPKLIANRLYRLSFTYLPPMEMLNEPAQVIGQIDWFRY